MTPEQEPKNVPARNGLWTRDFTIITVGSVVSMLGNALAGFAMDLMVLDYTGSTLLYAVYNILYMLPNALAPALIGPFLDRFSRKRTIYTLDFFTAGLFAVLAGVLAADKFSFWAAGLANFLLGGIGGIYSVAYQSFYPLLITEGNYQRAYSVASTLETMSLVMVPVSALVYNVFGIVPLFLANTLTFFVAAVLETQIRTEERYMTGTPARGGDVLRRFTSDFREGIAYLRGERGLLAIAGYFFFSSLTGGMTGVVTLPYFRRAFPNGEFVFMLVWGTSCVARCLGGLVHYRLKLPVKAKFSIAMASYVLTSLLEGTYLFFPVGVMMGMTFCSGLLGITSYTIRLSATQKYVPDGKKGRFNGVFNTLNTVGVLLGQGLAGALSQFMGERRIVFMACGLCLAAAVIFMGGGHREAAKIYNTET